MEKSGQPQVGLYLCPHIVFPRHMFETCAVGFHALHDVSFVKINHSEQIGRLADAPRRVVLLAQCYCFLGEGICTVEVSHILRGQDFGRNNHAPIEECDLCALT